MRNGKLTVVPTPVGNLEDITFRALKVLKDADLILAEDTRTTGVLLKHYEIKTPMKSHHKFNEHESAEGWANKILNGAVIALVTDAGTPGISDPGFLLIRECRRIGAEVEALPGATAFVPAIVASGLPCDRFVFEGFLPQKKGRQTRLQDLASESRTIVLYESPLRLSRTLSDLIKFFGEDREAVVCREISKLYETYHQGTLKQLSDYFSENQAKGEIVIVIGGNVKKKIDKTNQTL